MKPKYDAIVVLSGGRFNSGNLTPLSIQRMDKGIELFKEGAAPIICALVGHKKYEIIHDKFHPSGQESQAYLGVKKR